MLNIDTIHDAMALALDEADVGRTVMVLVPDGTWLSSTLAYYGKPRNIHVRASTMESTLKSVPLDSLILVGKSHPDWNKVGELCAYGKLDASADPCIFLFDNPEGEVE